MCPAGDPSSDQNEGEPLPNVNHHSTTRKHPVDIENVRPDTSSIMRQHERPLERTSQVSPSSTRSYGENHNRREEVEIIDLADDNSESEAEDGNREISHSRPLQFAIPDHIALIVEEMIPQGIECLCLFSIDYSYVDPWIMSTQWPATSPLSPEDIAEYLSTHNLDLSIDSSVDEEDDEEYSEMDEMEMDEMEMDEMEMDESDEPPSEDQIVTILDEPDEDEHVDRQSLVTKARSDQ